MVVAGVPDELLDGDSRTTVELRLSSQNTRSPEYLALDGSASWSVVVVNRHVLFPRFEQVRPRAIPLVGLRPMTIRGSRFAAGMRVFLSRCGECMVNATLSNSGTTVQLH